MNSSREMEIPMREWGREMRDPITDSVRYIMTRYESFDPEDIDVTLPPDIRKRIMLSRSVLSQLPTTVVFPDVKLSEKLLRDSVEYSNAVLENIGLSKSRDLYIRTRSQGAKTGYSRRSLIVSSTNGAWKYSEYIDSEKKMKEYPNIESWQKTLGGYTFLMIHSEDVALQRKCLHGSINIVDGIYEIFLSTGRIHARGLAERMDDKPWLRFRGNYQIGTLRGDRDRSRERKHYSSEGDALTLANWWLRARASVEILHDSVIEVCGEEVVIEFRVYPGTRDGEMGEGKRGKSMQSTVSAQVLDVNARF